MAAKQSTRARTRIPRNSRNIAALDILQRIERGEGSLEDIVLSWRTHSRCPCGCSSSLALQARTSIPHVCTIQGMVESYVAGYKGAEQRAAS